VELYLYSPYMFSWREQEWLYFYCRNITVTLMSIQNTNTAPSFSFFVYFIALFKHAVSATVIINDTELYGG
jgi:hypothetical protein